jgi:hypothetical protein
MDSGLFEYLRKKITKFKRSSEKTCPTENNYCSLLCVQFHHDSTFRSEIFYRYSIEAACNFDASHASEANFIK